MFDIHLIFPFNPNQHSYLKPIDAEYSGQSCCVHKANDLYWVGKSIDFFFFPVPDSEQDRNCREPFISRCVVSAGHFHFLVGKYKPLDQSSVN